MGDIGQIGELGPKGENGRSGITGIMVSGVARVKFHIVLVKYKKVYIYMFPLKKYI